MLKKIKKYLRQVGGFFLHEVVLLEFIVSVVLVPRLQEVKPLDTHQTQLLIFYYYTMVPLINFT